MRPETYIEAFGELARYTEQVYVPAGTPWPAKTSPCGFVAELVTVCSDRVPKAALVESTESGEL